MTSPVDPPSDNYPPAPQGYGGAPVAQRPSTITTAAVIAFVLAGLGIIGNLLVLLGGSIIGSGLAVVLAILGLAIAAIYIWAGIQALGGKDGTVLVIIAGVGILLNLIFLIVDFNAIRLIGFILPGLIIAMMLNAQSREWLRARGGKTY